jgi:hypothetical protein
MYIMCNNTRIARVNLLQQGRNGLELASDFTSTHLAIYAEFSLLVRLN